MNSWEDVSKVGVMVGGQGIATGDQQAYTKAVLADINKHGGIAGRVVVPVFYDFKTSQFADQPGATAAACAMWTQDRPVFAVVYMELAGLLTSQLATCLQKYDVPMIDMSYPPLGPTFDRFPLVWSPMSARWARYFPAVVQRAKAQGYFTGWDTTLGRPGTAPVKIGIQTGGDDPDFVKFMTHLVEAAGYPVVATGVVAGAGDSSGAQATVLKFKQAGVTHVIQDSQCVGGTIPFHETAESQHYRPRVMLQTGNCPELLERFIPKAQYAGAMGAGMQQTADVDPAHDPGDPSPARPKCDKVMRDANQNPNYSRDAQLFMYFYCDSFAFLTAAVNNGGSLSAENFMRGAGMIRTMPPSSTFKISFVGGRRDGASVVRDLIFRSDCQCTAYVGGNHPI